MKILLALVVALCAWSAMSALDDFIKSDFSNNIFKYEDDLLPASFEANLTYTIEENIVYNVTVRFSDYFNIVFYNLTFFDYFQRKYEYETATYNFNYGYMYNHTSYNFTNNSTYSVRYYYNTQCYYQKLNYTMSHPIISFVNMIWGYNKDKVYQSTAKKGRYHQIFEMPVDNGTHFYMNITRSIGKAPKINSVYGMFLDHEAIYNLTSHVQPKMFSIRNLYPEVCWNYATGRHY